MIFWPIFFISLVLANDEYSVEEYCFSSPSRMLAVTQKSKIIFVPSDVISTDGSCLTVRARPHRRELIQNYIRNIEPDISIKFSSAEIKREPCHLKVEKIRQLNRQTTDAKLEATGFIEASQENAESKDVSSITTLSDFELTVDQDVIKGHCRYVTPERYEITIEVRTDPKPLVTGVELGANVVLANPMPQPDQKTSRLSTIIQMEKGQRVELGSVVKDLKNKSNKVDITPSVIINDTQGTQQEIVYLSFP